MKNINIGRVIVQGHDKAIITSHQGYTETHVAKKIITDGRFLLSHFTPDNCINLFLTLFQITFSMRHVFGWNEKNANAPSATM